MPYTPSRARSIRSCLLFLSHSGVFEETRRRSRFPHRFLLHVTTCLLLFWTTSSTMDWLGAWIMQRERGLWISITMSNKIDHHTSIYLMPHKELIYQWHHKSMDQYSSQGANSWLHKYDYRWSLREWCWETFTDVATNWEKISGIIN